MTPDPIPSDAPQTTDNRLPPDVRRRLVERFEVWLDRAAAGEPPPPGVPPELLAAAADDDAAPTAGPDLYAVVAALTTVAGEVRLQGRTFKQLADTLGPVLDDLRRQANPPADGEAAAAASLLPSSAALVEVVLDLYDRLRRGLDGADAALAQARVPPPGWVDRLLRRRTVAGPSTDALRAMRDGYALTLSRLDAALHQWDVEPIGKVGEPFDPGRMVAVDVRPPADGQPAGTVVEVNRTGSAVRGTVLTPARVTVAR